MWNNSVFKNQWIKMNTCGYSQLQSSLNLLRNKTYALTYTTGVSTSKLAKVCMEFHNPE